MQSMNELYVDEGASASFSFFHLTLQEFMAAFQLSEQPVERQIEHFLQYGSKVRNRLQYGHFQVMLQFLAGLGKFAGYPTDRIRSILSNCESSSELQISLDGLHWIFEAQGSSSVCEAIGVSMVNPLLRYRRLSSFNCFVLGYSVTHSHCPWEIELEDCGIGNEGLGMLVRGSLEGESSQSGYISVLNLERNEITGSGLNQLLMSPAMLKLDVLDLSYNLIGNGGATPLLRSSLRHSIGELRLFETGIGVEDCRALGELLSSSPTLAVLKVANNNLTPEAIQLLLSGLRHNSTLTDLSLGLNPLGRGGAVPLLKSGVAQNLIRLWLHSTRIGEEDCRALGELLTSSSTRLQCLDISKNRLPPMAMQFIVRGLQFNTTVNNLYIMGNSLGSVAAVSLLKSPLAHRLYLFTLTVTGVEDCRALGELLSSSPNLRRLQFSARSDLPPEAVELIITGLQQNTALETLHVLHLHFSLRNCIFLASVLKNHCLLCELKLIDCSFDADGSKELTSGLSGNVKLQTLWLKKTPVGISGAMAIAQMLAHNKSLVDLKLNHESIGPEGTLKLIESLSYNDTLLRLTLPSRYMSFVSASETYRKERGRIRWQ